MKNFINGFGTCFAFVCAVLLAVFMWWTYPKATKHGYTPEMEARMDELYKNITPLSVADLGELK